MPQAKTITPKDAAAWRAWLDEHHSTEVEVWLVYVKKAHGRSISWSDAVDEALCFGWIDTTVAPIDDKHYKQRFTRRKRGSKWSEINKQKVLKLTAEGRMRPAGLAEVDAAKASGEWHLDRDRAQLAHMPDELEAVFKKSKKAAAVYAALAPGYQKLYRRFVGEAKQPDTRVRRAKQCAAWLLEGLKNPWGASQARKR